jgi:hypothetical protein
MYITPCVVVHVDKILSTILFYSIWYKFVPYPIDIVLLLLLIFDAATSVQSERQNAPVDDILEARILS